MLKSVLGESLTVQHRFAEAETILLEAYETQKTRVLPQEYYFTETRRRLAELYRTWGKTSEAKKTMNRLRNLNNFRYSSRPLSKAAAK